MEEPGSLVQTVEPERHLGQGQPNVLKCKSTSTPAGEGHVASGLCSFNSSLMKWRWLEYLPWIKWTWAVPALNKRSKSLNYGYGWAKGFPGGSVVKNLPASVGYWQMPWNRKRQSTLVFLSGKIPWIEETGGLQSMGSQRVGHDLGTEHTHTAGLLQAEG